MTKVTMSGSAQFGGYLKGADQARKRFEEAHGIIATLELGETDLKQLWVYLSRAANGHTAIDELLAWAKSKQASDG